MKTIAFSLLFFMSCIPLFAQDESQCRKLVELTKECINNKDSEGLTQHLSKEFTMAGQTGQIAPMVLEQVLSQLNDPIVSITPVSSNKVGNELELKYLFEYSEMGEKETFFRFDENNMLNELELFQMEVKTMSEETKITQNDKKVIEIPFTMAGNLIVVDVLLNGKKRKFILDSGAPKVILNAKYVAKKEGYSHRLSSSKGVNGGISGMDFTRVEHLDFAGIQLKDQEVISMDLAHLEEELDFEFHGLIGYEVVKDFDLLFDYDNHQLTLIAPDHFEQFRTEELTKNRLSSVPFQMGDHIPIIEAKVGNEIVHLGIDTGAETNLLDDDLFASLGSHVRNVESDTLSGAGKQSKVVQSGDVKKLTIGQSVFKDASTFFSDISHLNEGYQLALDGLIGYPILSNQKTLISFRRKELTFIN